MSLCIHWPWSALRTSAVWYGRDNKRMNERTCARRSWAFNQLPRLRLNCAESQEGRTPANFRGCRTHTHTQKEDYLVHLAVLNQHARLAFDRLQPGQRDVARRGRHAACNVSPGGDAMGAKTRENANKARNEGERVTSSCNE